MLPPTAILVALAVGMLLALLAVGTLLNSLAARWSASRWSTKDYSRKSWGTFLTANFAAIGTAMGAFVVVYAGAYIGRSLLGVRDLPGPPAPGFGGPPGWYLLLCFLAATASAALTDVIVFLRIYRRHG